MSLHTPKLRRDRNQHQGFRPEAAAQAHGHPKSVHGRERRQSGAHGRISKPGWVGCGFSRGYGGNGPGLPADGGGRGEGCEGEAQEHGALGEGSAARTEVADEVTRE